MIRLLRAAGAVAVVGITSCAGNPPRTANDSAQTPKPARLELVAPARAGIRRADSLELRASTVIDDSVLTLRITLVNHSGRTRRLSWAPCSMSPQLYREQSLDGRPVYDWNGRPNPDPELGRMFCPTYRIDKELAPGDSVAPQEYIERVLVRRLAGDSLAAARYFVAADVRLSVDGPGNTQRNIVPAGIVRLIR